MVLEVMQRFYRAGGINGLYGRIPFVSCVVLTFLIWTLCFLISTVEPWRLFLFAALFEVMLACVWVVLFFADSQQGRLSYVRLLAAPNTTVALYAGALILPFAVLVGVADAVMLQRGGVSGWFAVPLVLIAPLLAAGAMYAFWLPGERMGNRTGGNVRRWNLQSKTKIGNLIVRDIRSGYLFPILFVVVVILLIACVCIAIGLPVLSVAYVALALSSGTCVSGLTDYEILKESRQLARFYLLSDEVLAAAKIVVVAAVMLIEVAMMALVAGLTGSLDMTDAFLLLAEVALLLFCAYGFCLICMRILRSWLEAAGVLIIGVLFLFFAPLFCIAGIAGIGRSLVHARA